MNNETAYKACVKYLAQALGTPKYKGIDIWKMSVSLAIVFDLDKSSTLLDLLNERRKIIKGE